MPKSPEEWIKQALYDLNTAEYMFAGARYVYTVFMCHLSIEKALKGLYQKKMNADPPRTHNLIYLIDKIDIKADEKINKFLIRLNQVSIVTRYPEDLSKMQNDYTKEIVNDLLSRTKEALEWIRKMF